MVVWFLGNEDSNVLHYYAHGMVVTDVSGGYAEEYSSRTPLNLRLSLLSETNSSPVYMAPYPRRTTLYQHRFENVEYLSGLFPSYSI